MVRGCGQQGKAEGAQVRFIRRSCRREGAWLAGFLQVTLPADNRPHPAHKAREGAPPALRKATANPRADAQRLLKYPPPIYD